MYETPMNVALAVYVMRKGEAIITLCKTRNTIRRRSASPVIIVKKICLYMEREPCNRKALCFLFILVRALLQPMNELNVNTLSSVTFLTLGSHHLSDTKHHLKTG